ncbi:hypothetical protein SH580_12300 [Coraliomargarita algicola]|uniref:Uncharacterized protein n=1 Tax=Coraliomargarita algicola TaxID=3092156 RepID=A0ABZ0RDH7_9BACT|nr:hypothetical protein [Coraliomargarita sp. J2-16]WPJ94215.1 hypothetical protein SH580_12300 [Coraliomargarita sp. J2-16]
MNKQSDCKLTIGLFATLVICLLIAVLVYPDDWVIPLPLAAVFGPFLGMKLGLYDSFPLALLAIGLIAPIAFKRNKLRVFLSIIGICIWAFVGLACGAVLYA